MSRLKLLIVAVPDGNCQPTLACSLADLKLGPRCEGLCHWYTHNSCALGGNHGKENRNSKNSTHNFVVEVDFHA
jgi:hypothetical protein